MHQSLRWEAVQRSLSPCRRLINVTCDADHIDWEPRKRPVPNIQTLRHDIEREGDKAVRKGSRQQLVTGAAALMTGCDEQFPPETKSPQTQLRAKPTMSPLASATHKPSTSSFMADPVTIEQIGAVTPTPLHINQGSCPRQRTPARRRASC
jgi:hypothetical protein